MVFFFDFAIHFRNTFTRQLNFSYSDKLIIRVQLPRCGGQVFDHGFDHELEEEPSRVESLVPGVARADGPLERKLLVD